MIPINLGPIEDLSTTKLNEKLEYRAYEFCNLVDFTKTEAALKNIETLEMLAMEAVMRVLEDNLPRRPLQNKIYEKIEMIFGDQDTYNINRMMSSLRRAKAVGSIDVEDEKYLKWLKNRVSYGVKSLIRETEKCDHSEIIYED